VTVMTITMIRIEQMNSTYYTFSNADEFLTLALAQKFLDKDEEEAKMLGYQGCYDALRENFRRDSLAMRIDDICFAVLTRCGFLTLFFTKKLNRANYDRVFEILAQEVKNNVDRFLSIRTVTLPSYKQSRRNLAKVGFKVGSIYYDYIEYVIYKE